MRISYVGQITGKPGQFNVTFSISDIMTHADAQEIGAALDKAIQDFFRNKGAMMVCGNVVIMPTGIKPIQ